MEYSADDIKVLTGLEAVRLRPGMYIGNCDSRGVLHLVLEVLANAYDQHLAGRCSTVSIVVGEDDTITVEDDGPGIPMQTGPEQLGFEQLLTQLSHRPTVDGHRPHAHLGVGGLGLPVVNGLSERLEVVSVREGIESRVVYARGECIEPLVRAPTQRPSGTTIRFRPDGQIFETRRVSRVALATQLEELAFLTPGLRLRWSIAGDGHVGVGLAGRVAATLPCPVAEVAHHRGTYDAPSGPIDIEVALAWRTGPWDRDAPAVIDSFANLKRTSGGSHVEGVRAGLRRFLGPGDHTLGLVASVAVLLSDVRFGSPTRELLVTPIHAPVAKATYAALAHWAATHAAEVATLRDLAATRAKAKKQKTVQAVKAKAVKARQKTVQVVKAKAVKAKAVKAKAVKAKAVKATKSKTAKRASK